MSREKSIMLLYRATERTFCQNNYKIFKKDKYFFIIYQIQIHYAFREIISFKEKKRKIV